MTVVVPTELTPPTHLQNGYSQGLWNVATDVGIGVYKPAIFVYNIVPFASGSITLIDYNNIVADTAVPLNSSVVVTEGGYTFANIGYLNSVIFVSNSTFDVSGTLLITGLDDNFNVVEETLGFTSGEFVALSVKTYIGIISVVPSTTLSDTASLTNGLILGFPHYIPRSTSIISMNYNGSSLMVSNFSNIIPGQNWRDHTPSLITTSAHGSIDLSSVTFVTDALFTMVYMMPGISADLQFQLTNPQYNFVPYTTDSTFVSPITQRQSLAQAIIYANSGSSPVVNVPALVPFDETGVQYPSNMIQYNKFPTG